MSLFENIFNTKTEDKIEFFDLLARLNNFTKIKERVYEDKNGVRYVQTKLGFQKAEQYNLKLLNDELEKKILHLETDLRVKIVKLKEKNLKYSELQKEYKLAFKNKKYDDKILAKQQQLSLLKSKKIQLKSELKKDKIQLKVIKEEIKDNSEYFNLNINEAILFAENKQAEKLLRKIKEIMEYQDFLMIKTKDQHFEINTLNQINKDLKNQLEKLKEEK